MLECKIRPSNFDGATNSIFEGDVEAEQRAKINGSHKACNICLCFSVQEANALMTDVDESSHSQTSKQTDSKRSSKPKKAIFCLGNGLVASPLVEYLSRDPFQHVKIVSGVLGEAEGMQNRFSRPNIHAFHLNILTNELELKQLIREADCVVSLLPASMHDRIASFCISSQVPMVTASYVSPGMKQLHLQAQKANIPILCELGLDLGVDHMSAVKVIDHVKALGGTVISFSSVCGGLPSPEAADNPIGYKFSWSPRGVLTAALNTARY